MRAVLIVVVSLFMSGCTAISTAPNMMPEMVGVDGVTVIATGKTISDHIVSYVSGKNCSTVRKKTGQNFCEEDDLSTPEEIYCYKSLGSVSCYAEPQPYGQPTTSVGHTSGKSGLTR